MPMKPRRGQARCARHRKSCASSSSLGGGSCDRDAQRAGLVEHVPDGAVLARRVDALQHHQQRALALGVQPVLQLVDGLAVLGALLLGRLPVREGGRIVWFALVEMGTLARLEFETAPQSFWPWFGPGWSGRLLPRSHAHGTGNDSIARHRAVPHTDRKDAWKRYGTPAAS